MTQMDRLLMAGEALKLTWERREHYLSDDDILDAAESWSTSDEEYAFIRDCLYDWVNDPEVMIGNE